MLRATFAAATRNAVFAFHGAIPAEARKKTISEFSSDDDCGGGDDDGNEPLPRLLVCTDRASRGMDFRDVGHVVLFDFPRDGIEWVALPRFPGACACTCLDTQRAMQNASSSSDAHAQAA